jgi:mRNA-degrading endonuclease toxin of MazEF toxin-antitoxin module
MFDTFNNVAIAAILHAQNEASRLGRALVGTEFLILGLQTEGEGLACQALKSVGVKSDRLLVEVEQLVGKDDDHVTDSIDVSFTPRCKEVFRSARELAAELGDHSTDTEHLLLAMLKEGKGRGVEALLKLEVDLPTLTREILTLRHTRSEDAKNTPPVHISQGDVVLVGFVEHDEDGNPVTRRRPLIVVSTNSSIPRQNTLAMVPLIQKSAERPAGHFEVAIDLGSPAAKSAGLRMDSIAACGFVYSYPKSWCVAKIGSLPSDTTREICEQVWESIKPQETSGT